MGFYDQMKQQTDKRKTLTANGAIAYGTSGKEITDFNFAISQMRGKSDNSIQDAFEKVFLNEGAEIASRYAFYVGDCREGVGERKIFRNCMRYLAKNQSKYAKAVMNLIPEYNRWDSILPMLDYKETADMAIEIIKKQLNSDITNMIAGKPISLCAKWMPSVNASSETTKKLANTICKKLGCSQRKYRKRLAKLRAYLNVVETKMSDKKWGEIDYSAVPSKANLIYNNAFLRNDEERRREFLGSLKKGEAKINAGVLMPDEIIKKYGHSRSGVDETLEELWKNLPQLSTENNLIVRDGSGSMIGKPLEVATALAIYMSEHNSGEWNGKFVTFSRNPKIVDLSNCETLRDKIRLCYRENDYSNTDIYKTMMLILNTAIANKIEQDDMPSMITIISDMQFDGRNFNLNKSLFDEIREKFEENGYNMPRICFWNVSSIGYGNTIPMQENPFGLILCSGYSVQIMNMFLSNKLSPYEVLMDEINKPRYDAVAKAIKSAG